MVNILVVEDEPGIYNFLRQGLEEESFVVDIADKGSVGLDLALSVAYDIILLDWMLPEVSGIEICRRVRERDPLTPIIFLTAKDTL